jgi:hypothetical protein
MHAEALVDVAEHGVVGAEKYFEVNVWLLRDSSE